MNRIEPGSTRQTRNRSSHRFEGQSGSNNTDHNVRTSHLNPTKAYLKFIFKIWISFQKSNDTNKLALVKRHEWSHYSESALMNLKRAAPLLVSGEDNEYRASSTRRPSVYFLTCDSWDTLGTWWRPYTGDAPRVVPKEVSPPKYATVPRQKSKDLLTQKVLGDSHLKSIRSYCGLLCQPHKD